MVNRELCKYILTFPSHRYHSPMIRLLSVFSTITLLVSILYSQVAEVPIIPEYILSIVIMCLFPLFAILYRYIRRDMVPSPKKKNSFSFLIFTLFISTLIIIFSGADTFTIISLTFFVFILMGKADIRIIFALAIVEILASPLFLLVLRQDFAVYSCVQAFYSLLLGTIALLISDRVSVFLSGIIAPITEPKWWKTYISELRYFSSIIGAYLPYIVIVIFLVSYSKFISITAINEWLLMSITIIMWAFLQFAPPLEQKWKIFIILISSITFLFMFETFIEGMIAIIFYLSLLALLEYRLDIIREKWLKISQYFAYEWHK